MTISLFNAFCAFFLLLHHYMRLYAPLKSFESFRFFGTFSNFLGNRAKKLKTDKQKQIRTIYYYGSVFAPDFFVISASIIGVT